ncbi:MAG TPA: TolC family protein [Terriglobia bacterium]|nr:TolC family protein [Terriglobia bacterium]
MMQRNHWIWVLFALALFPTAGCRYQVYHPTPIAPAQTAARLESETLQDSGLQQFIEKSMKGSVSWPPKAWDLRLLTLAAIYFNRSLQLARAQVAAAQAAEVTANMRPNPTFAFSPGVPSPYLITMNFLVPIITHGKRGIQVEEARNLSEAARLNLAQTAWSVRNVVRSALLSDLGAEHNLEVARAQARLRTERVARLEERLKAGEISAGPVAASQFNLLSAQLAMRTAEGGASQAKAGLAAALGIPTAGLAGAHFDWQDFDQLPSVTSLSPQRIQRAAVLNRLDVHLALAQYRAAEFALQLEIARQHPDFQIGPGYQYEEGNSFFAPTLALQLPIFNKNQGPVAQAKALRKEAAANLVATQQRVIAQSEQALAAYGAAYSEVQTAGKALHNLRRVQEPLAQKAYAVGEADWISLNTVQLQSSVAAGVWLNSIFQAQAALGQLEAAVEQPLEKQDSAPLVVGAAGGNPPVKGVKP